MNNKSYHRGIPININRPKFPLSLPATLPLFPYEACHRPRSRLSSLPHMQLRPQSAVRGNISQLLLQTDAPDPHLTHGRHSGVRSAAAPPTAAAFQPHLTLLRRPSMQSSTPPGCSPTTPNNSTQLSDVQHWLGLRHQKIADELSAFAHKTRPTTRHIGPAL